MSCSDNSSTEDENFNKKVSKSESLNSLFLDFSDLDEEDNSDLEIINDSSVSYNIHKHGRMTRKRKRKPKLKSEMRLIYWNRFVSLISDNNPKEAIEKYNHYKTLSGNTISQNRYISSFISLGCSARCLYSLFRIGRYRYYNLFYELNPNLIKTNSNKTINNENKLFINHFDKTDIEFMQNYIIHLENEEGFSCIQCIQNYYIKNYTKWIDIFHDYEKLFENNNNNIKKMGYKRFLEYLHITLPQYKLNKKKIDVCNVCFKLNTTIHQCNYNIKNNIDIESNKILLDETLEFLKTHKDMANDQRAMLKAFIESYCKDMEGIIIIIFYLLLIFLIINR
jgi:hypothetical protein